MKKLTARIRIARGASGWREAALCQGRRLALVAAAVASLAAGTALARDRIDQRNLVADNVGGGEAIGAIAIDGQTFTAGTTGALDRVAVYLERFEGGSLPPGNIILDIYPTDANGAPQTDSAAIGSGSIPLSDVTQLPGFVTIHLSRAAQVKKGKTYAMILHSDVDLGLEILWDDSILSDPYARGGDAQRADADSPWVVFPRQDHFFKTFVAESRQRHRR